MDRNINDFWTLMEFARMAVCDDCKAFEGRRPHAEYVRRRCVCVTNPGHFKHPGAHSQFCLQHMYARWRQILRQASPEITRRRHIRFNAPRLIKKKKGYESTKAANTRRAENRRRTAAMVAAGQPLGVEVLTPYNRNLTQCPCGKKAGRGQHRAGGANNHFRTY